MDSQTQPNSPSELPRPVPAPEGKNPLEMDRSDCLRLERALFREWIEADGLGGYASSTAHLCPTRRYHGLLVAPLPGGGERHVFLSRLEEQLVGQGKAFPISTARYRDTYAPEGYQSIENFSLKPFPTWTYQIGEVQVTREVVVVWGQHTVLVRWTRKGGPADVSLRLRPLLACRRSHDLSFENIDLNPRAAKLERGIVCQPYGALPPVTMQVVGPSFAYEADPVWYRSIEYQAELRRGFPGHEDQFSPGRIEVPLPENGAVVFAATLGPEIEDPAQLWQQEEGFRRSQFQGVRSFSDRLVLASDGFLYRDAHGRTGIVAGYPWFGEWGRDTFLSLPGMSLPPGALTFAWRSCGVPCLS